MRLFLSSERKFFLPFAIAAIAGLALMSIVGVYTVTAQTNEPPEFVEPELEVSIAEGVSIGTRVATYTAVDPEGDDVSYSIWPVLNEESFQIAEDTGVLTTREEFDFETGTPCLTCELVIIASDGTNISRISVEISVTNINDERPEFVNPKLLLSIAESIGIGSEVATYTAVDPDGDDIDYDMAGRDAEWFDLSDTGILTTRVHFDFETGTPCRTCLVTITASDRVHTLALIDVVIYVTNVDDFTSTVKASKANPVPGRQGGNPEHALDDVPEKYVEAAYANLNAILRFEVTSESPDPDCGKGNDCVFLSIESSNAGAEQKLTAMRSAAQGALFVTAVKLVETEESSGETVTITGSDGAEHPIELLKVEAEDHARVKFGNLRLSIAVENEPPVFASFGYTRQEIEEEDGSAPEEMEVDFVFEVNDSLSGIPQPEDLPDTDGDDDYISVVALAHDSQCYYSEQPDESLEAVSDLIMRGDVIYCDGQPEVRPITDDRDFQGIDGGGYEIRTTVVLPAETTSYVTFVVCDNAGNCTAYDQVKSDDAVLLEISPSEVTPPGDACLEPIAGDAAVQGSLDAACRSTNKGGSYARYYTFDLSARAHVTIALSSKEDTYLFLLQGAGRDGMTVRSNDDIVSGNNHNSRIQTALDAGEYTIEATTYNPGVTGSFALTLETLEPSRAGPSSDSYTALAMGELHTCGLRADGAVVCWGNDDYNQVSGAPGGSFVHIAAGAHHTCAIGEDGAVACWGNDEYNQASGTPTGEFASIAVSSHHNCGIRTDGIVVCWGRNDYGQSAPP